jgi:hypothetical protein
VEEIASVREILYSITWAGKDITSDISKYLIELTYVDHLHGKSDEIDLVFEDREDLWKLSWYPQKGDIVYVRIGIKEYIDRWLNCGRFQIDEIEFDGPPDVISVKGLATFITEPLRQKRTYSWEQAALSTILKDIAKRNKLEPLLNILQDIRFKRIDQKDQTDLDFAKSICEKYGYCVKVDSERLCVAKIEELEKIGTVGSISRDESDIISFRFSTKTYDIYKECEVKYWDPVTKKTIKHIEKAFDIVSGSILKLSERFENKQQAIERARAELKKKNKWECESEVTLIGDPSLVAGATIAISGFGNLSGKYMIEEANHTISKSNGYTTSIRIRKI